MDPRTILILTFILEHHFVLHVKSGKSNIQQDRRVAPSVHMTIVSSIYFLGFELF